MGWSASDRAEYAAEAKRVVLNAKAIGGADAETVFVSASVTDAQGGT